MAIQKSRPLQSSAYPRNKCIMQTVSNVIQLMHLAILPVLAKADVAVDATAGNGYDTLFIAQNTPSSAQIYAFDVQSEALANTKERTAEYANRIHYLFCSHENIKEKVPGKIDVCLFNLGYLPGFSHETATRTESTRAAVESALAKLSLNGVCVLVVYPGHPEGKREADMLQDMLKNLPQREFTAGCYRLSSHKQTAPYAYLIERVQAGHRNWESK